MLLAAGNQIFVLEPDLKISWVYDSLKGAFDVWPLPNGNFLFSQKTGVFEVTYNKKIIWQYPDETDLTKSEINSCQPLSNGNILIMDSYNNRLIEVTRKKKIVTEIKLPSEVVNPYMRYRSGRKTRHGTYLVGMLPDKVLEYKRNSELIREIDLTKYGIQKEFFFIFEILDLDNGNLLISTGYDGRFLEITPKNELVWEVSKKTCPWLDIRFAAGALRLKNGNTIICNGDWHVKRNEEQALPLLEITPDYKPLWTAKYDDLKGKIVPVVDPNTGMKELRITQVKLIGK
jgi:hypothetical protein